MTTTNKTVLVFGATGRQGGATARHLLANGWHVRAFTRNPDQPASQALRQAGAEVIQGDNTDRSALEVAMQGMYGIFSMQAFLGNEVVEGKNIADVAKAVGVQHFVYASVQTADALARVGGDDNKWEIEQHIRALGLPTTILRPPFFMETLIAPRTDVPDDVVPDTFSIGVAPDVPMGVIAVDDIGVFATLAFEHPDAYLGKTIEIAGDILTPTQIAVALSRATGRTVPYVQIPAATIRQQNAMIANAIDFLNATGYSADVVNLRQQHPALMTLDTWLAKQGATHAALS